MVDFSKRELRRKSQSLPVREAQKNFIAGTFLLSNTNRRFKWRVVFFQDDLAPGIIFWYLFLFFLLGTRSAKKKR